MHKRTFGRAAINFRARVFLRRTFMGKRDIASRFRTNSAPLLLFLSRKCGQGEVRIALLLSLPPSPRLEKESAPLRPAETRLWRTGLRAIKGRDSRRKTAQGRNCATASLSLFAPQALGFGFPVAPPLFFPPEGHTLLRVLCSSPRQWPIMKGTCMNHCEEERHRARLRRSGLLRRAIIRTRTNVTEEWEEKGVRRRKWRSARQRAREERHCLQYSRA